MGTVSQGPTKQKAYDRYYNEMAKSDFVQGQKRKALIQKVSLDEASTASLANLFAQVMGKNREYEYDEITKKLTKAAEKPIKGKQSIGDVYSMMGADTPKSAKKPINKSTMYPSVREAMTPKRKEHICSRNN
ncbi:TPA: hypothetical protein N0F65_005405 [Lagenidium giganteum]|uniref:Uncharacterized protein n=1 Tax=Lagenidium giganteum TaxID=4803 RepID=A0AAV2Z2C1_9STRA|nr:TPA: hypothetical protein N0F65_005405 [Lagenidium giganteum]